MAGWGTQSASSRSAIWDQIPNRLSHLGVTCRRLPWTLDDIKEFVTTTLEAGRGTWVMGVVGAVAEFRAAEGDTTQVVMNGDQMLARTANAALEMTLNDDIRALTFDSHNASSAPRIVLAVKRERGRPLLSHGIKDLGVDARALIQEPRTRLFDLGLGRKEARFCVRVGSGAAHDALRSIQGVRLEHALTEIAATLLAESPTRVVETALGRIEVQGKIPPPGAVSPDGPHSHLLPDYLATHRALPTGMDLPRAYLPGAIFYPPR